MNPENKIVPTLVVILIAASILSMAQAAAAHCDSLDGPVITDARAALESGNVDVVLKWVKPTREREVVRAFEQTLKARKTGDTALTDRTFFETLVRIHREGEGAKYTGLKPAGQIEPAVKFADAALAAGDADGLVAKLTRALSHAIATRFHEVQEKAKAASESIEAGRSYVAAYVEYVHFVEALHDLIRGGHDHHEG